MIFSIYNDHVIVFNNSDLKVPAVQTFHRPADWFRNAAGFYLNIATSIEERAQYVYPPANYKDRSVWNTELPPNNSSKPVAILVNHMGCVYTLTKVGKRTIAALISDLSFGQNVLVSADASTTYIETDLALRAGKIVDIPSYIKALQGISSSSTQGGYTKTAWYCSLDDFGLCLTDAKERKFGDIESRWEKVSFEDSITFKTIHLDDIPSFQYANFAGFKDKDVHGV